MAVPILPFLGALSSVASTAWDTYNKVKRLRESALTQGRADAIAGRIETVENTCLEQAQLLSELSKDMEKFAQAMQAELVKAQRAQTRLTWVSGASLLIAVGSLVFILIHVSR
jgi:hypothetical protein